ncbi:MAG TPA: hypothetical protein VGG06_22530 [Thermoanaerobaculia bacterium]
MKGWRIVVLALFAVGLSLAAAFARLGWGEEGLRAAIRITAATSLVLFAAAFSASALAALAPSRPTRWQRANRRHLGIAFGLSHVVHGVAIVTLAATGAGDVLPSTAVEVAGGTAAYVFIVFMLATSFDRTAAWVGRRAWTVAHTTGGYLILAVFLVSYGGRALESPAYLPPVLVLLTVLALRVARAVVLWGRQPGATVG